MCTPKRAAVFCGMMGIAFLVVGVLCFFAPMFDERDNHQVETIAGISFILLSIASFILAHLQHRIAVLEDGERAYLLSV